MKLVPPMTSFAPSKEHQLEATQPEIGDPCEEIMKFTSHDLLVKGLTSPTKGCNKSPLINLHRMQKPLRNMTSLVFTSLKTTKDKHNVIWSYNANGILCLFAFFDAFSDL